MAEQPTREENHADMYDVLVAGGGMAGIAAATAAARQGARTLLIERAGWLGGLGFSGATGLHTFYNIHMAHPGAERMRTVRGLAQQLVDKIHALGGTPGHVPMERGGDFVSVLTPIEPELAKLAAVKLCQEAGVELLLHTTLIGVEANGGHIERVVVWNKAGHRRLRARQFIDCTGDGDLAAGAGAPFVHFGETDPGAYSAGFTFRLCNVNLSELEAGLEREGVITQLAHATKPGTARADLVRLGINVRALSEQGIPGLPHYFLSSSVRPNELTYCNCINYGPNDGLDPKALTNAENSLREQMLQVATTFRRHIPGCADSYPAGAAPSAGQRRGRAIRCQYELTEDDCVSGRQFDDQIGCFSFIDNPRHLVRDAGAYGIPYRALVPHDTDNLLIAGRMMTVDLVAHNSTRNTICCFVCGEAAGTAAAMAAQREVAPVEVPVEALRETLEAQGALLQPVPEPSTR